MDDIVSLTSNRYSILFHAGSTYHQLFCCISRCFTLKYKLEPILKLKLTHTQVRQQRNQDWRKEAERLDERQIQTVMPNAFIHVEERGEGLKEYEDKTLG